MSLLQVRIDKWLWAARFFKTRRLATDTVNAGHVRLNTYQTKASKAVKVGDVLQIQRAEECFVVLVLGLAEKRGSASIAQQLYQETPESVVQRALKLEQRKLQVVNAPQKRPDKKARRQIKQFIQKR